MVERAKEDETPIPPKANSPVPEIFSSKKIFFLNSCSGSRRSEIPHIESDYCPRDEVSRRLFYHGNESCDCDCTSDGCRGCLRRNKQCFFKFFVLALSIALILLLFGSLSYNLTRNKDVDESLEFEETKWAPHFHNYSASKEKEVPVRNTTNSAEIESVVDLPVPIYEHPDDYDSSEDLIKFHYNFEESLDVDHAQIEPISFPPINDQEENSQDEILLIYDGREPQRNQRFISSKSKREKRGLLKEKYEVLEKLKKPKRVAEASYESGLKEVNDLEEGMEKFWENYFRKRNTVFKAFSLTTPFYSTPMQSDERSAEEEIEEKLKNRFLSTAAPGDFHSVTTPKDKISKISLAVNSASADETENTILYENLFTEKSIRIETVNSSEHEWTTVTTNSYSSTESEMALTDSSEPVQTLYSTGNLKNSNFLTEKVVDYTYESNLEKDYSRNVEIPLITEDKAFYEVAATATTVEKNTSAREMIVSSKENSKIFSANERESRKLWPLSHFSVPFRGLFGSSQKDQVLVEPPPLDTIRGISLADAKKIKKERRKHLLLNSRVVGGSSDVGLPTGPDVSKPFVNAFETLKTNQQLSFTPSAASQFILPYQMCLFAGSFPGPKPFAQAVQPRTFSLGAPPLIPSMFDKSSDKSPYQVPVQQNFLTFSINNYPNAPIPHQPTQYSAGSTLNFPTQKQFSQIPGPNKQPLFCTYLQPPFFQFPTVPGTADFSHAKCVDCPGDSQKVAPFAKEFILPSERETFCLDDLVSCKDGSSCIPLKNWCDNQVHCKDASDEAFCSCRERLADDRLCDGYIDCPHGEDETACFDCPKSAFSCDRTISPDSCIPLSKRCDGVKDCSTGADETDCSALFFNMLQNNSYQVPQISGYLHRNWKGDWFPVCVEIDGSVWAKEACLGELGVLPPNVDVRFAPVSAHYKGPFIVRKEDGTAALQEHCKGHVSTFVKCPAMSCGTRVELYSLQKLENHYFQSELDRTNYGSSTFARDSLLTDESKKKGFEIKIFEGEKDTRLKREETGRVVGGRESEPRAWPWAIAVYKNGAFHCGGVILDESWVLTAAHCMEQYWKHYYEVRGGMLRRFSFSAMEQARTVSYVIIHENYDLTIMSSDLALLRLQKPFDFNRWVRPACLPVLQDEISKFTSGPAPGTRCTAVGWGALKERGTDPDQLREVEIPIMTRCKHKEDLVGEEICAGKVEGGKDTCQGDSGGPLLCRDSSSPASWYVAGIVSHGEGCARPGEPGAYTRISLFIDWITANTNDFQLPSVKPLQNCPGFRCLSASKLCIPQKWVCNGLTDCLEAEDEKNCIFDPAIANAFSNQYSSKYKHFESEDFEDTNRRKNISMNLNPQPTMSASEKKQNGKEKIIKIIGTKKKDLRNEKSRNGESDEFFDGEQVKKKEKGLAVPLSCTDQKRARVLSLPSLLTTSRALNISTTTDSFLLNATEEPSVSLGNLKMGKKWVINLGNLTTESEKNMHVFTDEKISNYEMLPREKMNNDYNEEAKKNPEKKNKGKKNTSDSEENQKLEIDEKSEDEINSESSEKEKEEEKLLTIGGIVLEGKKEEKSENKRDEVIYEHKEMKNYGVPEKKISSENDKNFEEKKTDYQKQEMKEESQRDEVSENGKNIEIDLKVGGHSGTEKRINKTVEDVSNEKFSHDTKFIEEKSKEEKEKDSIENGDKTENIESDEENSKEDKKNSEEEEKDSTSSEDWKIEKTENYSLQEDPSTTELFLMNSSQGTTKEILKSTDDIKDVEDINFKETEKFKENSVKGETGTEIEFTEPMVSFSTTEAVRESIWTQTEELIFRMKYLDIESANTTPSQHLTLRQETQGHLMSEEYPTTTIDSESDLNGRNSNPNGDLISEYFQCRLIVQSILSSYRCDGFEDCEDGTDEENCTCSQTLLRSSPELICDGEIDCSDRSDEKNCSKCLEDEFRCKISNECISKNRKCDGKTDCRFGEDESKCIALASNGVISLNSNGDPFLETEGILLINRNGIWRVKCQEETSVFAARDAIKVCSALGTIGYERFENRSLVSDNCTGFFVVCAKTLTSSLDKYQNLNGSYLWPWNAFVYSDGQFLCSAALLQSRWLLTSSHCFRNISLKINYLIAKLGGNNLSAKVKEEYDYRIANTIRIDGLHMISETNATLLHLSREVNQTESVRPLGIPYTFTSDPKRDICVAVGDQTVFLKISEDCPKTVRCYKRVGSIPSSCRSRPWAGVVACQSRLGWYPASVFLEKSGYCGFEDNTMYSNLQDHLNSLHYALDKKVEIYPEPKCSSFRCSNGFCIPLSKMCNGVADCIFGEDENFAFCKKKNHMKECKITELKCRNGHCIPKVLFGDGVDDCGDGSDEPGNATCVEYLRLTAPERICDGKRNCYDKTDEDYQLCSCGGGKFQCRLSEYCVPRDFVCDGEKDCPGGEDEMQCMGRQIVKNYSKTHLEVMQKSYGIWHTVCPSSLTKERSDALCRDLGFKEALIIYERNQTVNTPKLDAFSSVKLNRKTSIALRGDKPFVKLINLKRTCSFVKCA